VQAYAEAGGDAIAALFFCFSAADVTLEACREAATRTEG
jgi:hypothetical protein